MRSDLPTGTVTLLFTDIEGSTRLLHALGPERYAEALAEHRRVLRRAFAAHGGVEVDTQGDAFFVAFPTAPGAAAAASDAQLGLAPGPVAVRMGLHTGTPSLTSDGYVGVDVHRGARVAALAHGGQVLLTEATAALLANAQLTDLGRHRLKDFDGPARLLQLGTDAFPALRTPGAVSLPTPATSFLGRERELFDAVSTWLERDPRVLTIVGPGGTGKTRFAIELARLLAEDAGGGTVFIPFAPIADSALLLPAVADRLGAPGPEATAVGARVGEKRTHAVLDNLEHLLPDAARTIADLVAAAPELRLIVTSREPLRIAGESEFDLPPLASDEAVALFLSRGRDVRPDLVDTPAVGELCARLDRLPLPIELAAARTKVMGPEALVERLGRRLDLLRGKRDSEGRHATLRATIAWSYDLLDAEEQLLFARLSVFAAGCTLQSAEEVCDADLDVMASLVDKSLVRRRTGELGEERFWMLETIREFASECLERAGEEEDLGRRHAARMLAIAREAELQDDDTDGRQNHPLVLSERDDIRRALDWTAAHDVTLGLELATALESYFVAVDPAEGARTLENLITRATKLEPVLEAAALRAWSGTLYRSGEREPGVDTLRRSIAAYDALGDERRVVGLEIRLAIDTAYFGDVQEARIEVERVRRRATELGVPRVEAEALGALATIARREGDLESACELTRRSAEAARQCGFSWWEAGALSDLVELEFGLGRLDEAERSAREGLRIAVAIGERLVTLGVLVGLALVERERGHLGPAGRIWGAVLDDIERKPPPQLEFLEEMAAPFSADTEPLFLEAVEAGRADGLGAAIELALGDAQTEP
jgi:predicted ATPase/class 3 adenylate cyclase